MSDDRNVRKESEEQLEAFEYYYELGNDRSYSKVAIKFKKAITTIENWGRYYKWQDRLKEREKLRMVAEREKAIVEGELDAIQRNNKIRKKMIYEGAKQLNEGKMQINPKILLEVMEAEEKRILGYDKKIEVRHRHEIAKKSDEELEEDFRKRMDKLKRYEGAKQFDEMDDPIDAEYREIEEKEKEQ